MFGGVPLNYTRFARLALIVAFIPWLTFRALVYQ